MSTPTNGSPYQQRVVVEQIVDGHPRRVHVWIHEGQTRVSFPERMSEDEATKIVAQGLSLLKCVDVAALFEGPRAKRRRYIEAEEP